jgi:hypothetical protein
MDCRTARLLLDFARPLSPELEPSEADSLEGHLADCPECGGMARDERRADDRIRSAMRAVPVAPDFRARLLRRLDARRNAWYGRQVGRTLGVAAAVFIAVCAGWVWHRTHLPAVDPQAVVERANEKIAAAPADVEAWFRQKGYAVPLPPQFNYGLLADYDIADFQGKPVPRLEFVKGSARARVYVLTDRRFDLKALAGGERVPGSGYSLLGLGHPSDPHVVYLVLFTGESLEPFLSENQTPI